MDGWEEGHFIMLAMHMYAVDTEQVFETYLW